MSARKKARILMELRPALEGFAGIPQETRLIFSIMNELSNIEVTGIINHYAKILSPTIREETQWSSPELIHRRINAFSRNIVSYVQSPHSRREFLLERIKRRLYMMMLAARTAAGMRERIYLFDGRGFEDFIWSELFAKTLPSSEFDKITGGNFAVLRAPWGIMHLVGLSLASLRKYPVINTRGYDFFLSQTPYPARLTHGTRLLVRYHDAIPIFLPHTIPNTSLHQATHYGALKDNVRRGAFFVCTSQASRNDLLKLFPQAEKNSCVVHDVVSHNYFREQVKWKHVASIIRTRMDPKTAPKSLAFMKWLDFDSRMTYAKPLRYILMVSTLEPRKNHLKLIGAWERIRQDPGMEDTRLILVGERGWEYEEILQAMKPWQEQGLLIHLSRLPAGDLRALYNGAEAVVCPSLAEGFDLSGIEAMLCGAPVVASDIPVHREVYGEHATYFNPYSTIDLARELEKILTMKKAEIEERTGKAMDWAQQYKKEVVSEKWKDLIEELAG